MGGDACCAEAPRLLQGVMLSNPPGGNDGAYATTYNGEAYAAASAPPFLAPGKPYEQLGLPPTSKV